MTIKLGHEFWVAINQSCRSKTVLSKTPSDGLRQVERTLSGATDLYLWWAIETEFRSSQPSGGAKPWNIPFIVEGDVRGFVEELGARDGVRVPPEYLRPLKESALGCGRYFTLNVRVPRCSPKSPCPNDEDLDIASLKKNLNAIFNSKHVVRIQLGFPRGQFDNEEPVIVEAGHETASTPQAIWRDVTPASKIAPQNAKVVVGVIDDGAAFAHSSLRGAGGNSTRVSIMWSQSPELPGLNKSYWRLPETPHQGGSGVRPRWYGAMMREEQMNAAMQDACVNSEVHETACYGSLFEFSKQHRAIETRFRHGPAVLTTFAGAFSASKMLASEPDDLRIGVNNLMTDPCASAPIILVDLPYEQVAISSGRWMPIAALDGVRFILTEARALYKRDDGMPLPVVINISSGSTAGSHDGTSMFESALAELLDADPHLAVTIAAGNSRLSRVHTEVVIGVGSSGSVTFRVPPAKRFETYVEFWPEWLASPDDKPMPDASSLQFTVIAPDGRKIEPLLADGDGKFLKDVDNRIVAGMNYSENVVQACQRPMALLVIAATAPHPEFNHAPFGNWTVLCQNNSNCSVRLRSWIERDEVVFGVLRPQSAHFTDADEGGRPPNDWDEDRKSLVSRYDTMNNLANARGAFAVAAGTGGRESGFVSPYSGAGPESGVQRPKLISRADRSPAQPGIPVYGAYGGARQHMSGTSIAAPQAARWIANYMAGGHDRIDVEVLAQCSVPRKHPHLADSKTGTNRVASGEGKWFLDPNDPIPELCLGKPP